MSPALIPFLMTIAGGVVYHLCQKAAGPINPWSLLTFAYGSALAASALLWWLAPAGRALPTRPADVALAAAIGLSALAIEAGYFLIYRAGQPVSTTALLSNLCITVALAAVGVAALGEPLTAARAAGAVLAVVGSWLLVRG